jgi:hypothetical protein
MMGWMHCRGAASYRPSGFQTAVSIGIFPVGYLKEKCRDAIPVGKQKVNLL